MKKLFLKLLITTSSLMLLSAPVFATTPSVAIEQQLISNAQETSVSPRAVFRYPKTVRRTYQSTSEIPNSIFYEEYHNVYGTCRGTLYFDYAQSLSNGWIEVFYTGTMMSNNI